MSYFDHVRCPSCGAHLDPEALDVREGAARCPHCSSQIGLRDLFGVADAFVDEDEPHVTIDDLVPGGSRVPPRHESAASVAPAPPRAPRAIEGPTGVLGILRDLKKGR
jgi:DNA-directed RNA polymerase subunit RPC12/RpoP